MSTPENSSSDPRPTSRMDTSRMGSPGRQGQGPSGPQEPAHTRFKGFRDTSQPERRRPPRPEPRKEKASEENTEEEAAEKETAKEETADDEETEGAETEAVGDEAVGDEAEDGDRWDEVTGFYEDGNRKEARSLAARLARAERTFATPRHSEELHVLAPSTVTYGPAGEQALKELLAGKLGPHYSRREAREIAARIRAETYVEGLGTAEAIPLRNGDLSFRPKKLKDPAPKRRFRVRSPARWRQEASCTAFQDFLREAVPTRVGRRALQEYLGYCLMHWARPYRHVLVLAGPEGSGWELFLRAVSAVVPWIASVGPKRLARGTAASRLRGPWVNARAGISAEALTELQVLRGHVAGRPSYNDPSQIQEVVQVPSSQWATKHIYTTTELPSLAAGDRFFRRIVLVPFPAKLSPGTASIGTLSMGDTDRELSKRFEAERDGIFQWALEGLDRVLEAEANGEGFPSARPAEKTRQRWESLSGPIGRFKAARLEVTGDPQDVVSKKTLYPAYKKFCQQERVFAETKTEFTQTLTEDPRVENKDRIVESGGDQVPCYVGVKMQG